MLRENIEEQCRRICPDNRVGKSACAFAPHGGAIGFIDTSSACDGSRGIAFFSDRMYVNTDGASCEIAYKSISGSQIINSFEDAFADELSILSGGFELRISDYSLNKSELKHLLDELCREQDQLAERRSEQVEKYADMIAQRLAEDTSASSSSRTEPKAILTSSEPTVSADEYVEIDPFFADEGSPVIAEVVVDIPEERMPLPRDYAPDPIPEESINWISGKGNVVRHTQNVPPAVESPKEKPRPKPMVAMSGVIERVPVIGERKPTYYKKDALRSNPEVPENDPTKAFEKPSEMSETEVREQIENMSSDEMMTFLAETLNDINDQSDPFFEQTETPKADYSSVVWTAAEHSDIGGQQPELAGETGGAVVQEQQDQPQKQEPLTVEPIWGDIYIKASKNLRELCESGKLTMEQMEAELKANLLGVAEAFEKITGDESRVPKVMMPKITELKAAAADFDRFFGYGEDIAVRAMFFMMYQMLSYADRIAESSETKSRLNDFFRRFGSAGITLSMLDMRV